MSKQLASFVLTAVIAAPVGAAPQTVTLAVPGMTCAACPITVKQALSKVTGVTKTEVIFEKREAIVTFNNAITNVQALTEATKNAVIRVPDLKVKRSIRHDLLMPRVAIVDPKLSAAAPRDRGAQFDRDCA